MPFPILVLCMSLEYVDSTAESTLEFVVKGFSVKQPSIWVAVHGLQHQKSPPLMVVVDLEMVQGAKFPMTLEMASKTEGQAVVLDDHSDEAALALKTALTLEHHYGRAVLASSTDDGSDRKVASSGFGVHLR
jgi:hypothetical protein